MDACVEKRESGGAAVLMVENEAESMQGERSGATDHNYLDTCPVCHLNFHSREPKLLPCLHSFCKKCLPLPSRNLDVSVSKGDSATKALNVIRCPVCRQECMAVDVMDNMFVKDSSEAPSSTVARAVQLCMACDDNTEAAGFCAECIEYLCTTCVEAHQRVKFTKDHMIRQKSEDVCTVSSQRPMFCHTHKQEPLKLFCETCDLLTCRDCQLVKHKDHNYQFLEAAYKNHKEHMESMTHQLQEKKKLIEEVSNSINSGLLLVEQNRTSVHDEIKKSICSLIHEINKKGKMLVNQLEALTKDHESLLHKQQEDIGYLSRHLDHVIDFIKWATAKNGGTALLYCKRLIQFQIGNLLRAKCSASFVPQSTVRFQCRASYWASNVDLGTLVVESIPDRQLGGFHHQLTHTQQGPSGSPHSLALGAPCSTLAQLQMQVDKLTPQAQWQPQPSPPPWTWYQSIQLQRTVPRPLQRGSPSHSLPPKPDHRFMRPLPNHVSPTRNLLSPGLSPQRGTGSDSSYQTKPMDGFSSSPLYAQITPLPLNGSVNLPHSQQRIEPTYMNRSNDSAGPVYTVKPNYPQGAETSLSSTSVPGQQNSPEYAAVSQEKTGTGSWKAPKTHHASGAVGSAVKKRQRSSPGPIIVIKDEPDDEGSCVHPKQRASLPDSTDDQPQTHSQGDDVPSCIQSIDDKPHCSSQFPSEPLGQNKTRAPNPIHSVGEQQQEDQNKAQLEDSNEVLCAVCQTTGELLCCHKCHKGFHLTCHIPALLKSPSREWFCTFCRDLLLPEMEYDCKPEAKTVKKEMEFEGAFSPVDKRKCERLLLYLFCSELNSDFQNSVSPLVRADSSLTTKGPMSFSTVRIRLDAEESACYQSPAEFVSDIRLIFGAFSECQSNTEIAVTCRKFKELFEDYLKLIYPDQTFPEIKQEMIQTASPDCQDSQLSSLDNMSLLAKRRRTYSDSRDAPSCYSREEGIELKLSFS
ncbi:transcription intermediary factor 1-alpha-like [Archocentrus centrarchus]|uniref:transcription intermediary factor 1-alpha-like n=1 Tax=Archocentrus centrarchus TaxID=63155 RepID=UPI0011E9DA42|nr:transcription intermediary factor 1-alpha-like [Archocentrus centrarchus]XP_030587657.1 transcription intermediary factor 1-alpha-like [Archocentrus centrarchus]